MATLVLTAVGSALGGPIGGALGAVLGQTVDARLLSLKGGAGSRLSDLRLQSSSYGTPLPKLFGRMRVAGTVIWATDLQEHRDHQGGGKGRPSSTTYSYSASFAVALSARPIRAVHRIWADGKLLRGSAGDWKSATSFRLHLGEEEQSADPLIASAEGIGTTPAYRGTAYAVFEDLDLTDFGNRIPALTFEVEADAGAVPLSRIVEALTEGRVTGATESRVAGYAVADETVRGTIDALAQLYPVRVVPRGSGLVLVDAESTAIPLPAGELGATASDAEPRVMIERGAAGEAPEQLSVAYFDPARDYQSGTQRARRRAPARRSTTVDLAAALSAEEAKAAVEEALARAWAERRRATVRLPWRRVGIAPGDTVIAPGLDGSWRVEEASLERMAVELRLVATAPPSMGSSAATAGRPTREPDAVAGTTVIALLDLPPLSDTPADTLSLWVAAAGTGAGWRRADLMMSSDEGASWSAVGGTAMPAIMGSIVSVPDRSTAALVDRLSSCDVELLHEGMSLIGRDEDALAGGANLAMIGDELIQFGRAAPLGGRRWRLSELWRGRRGTEASISGHVVGERFVLVEAASLARIELPLAVLDRPVRVTAAGVGDGSEGAEAETIARGRALRPPAPAALAAARLDDGTVRIEWVRRSRTGWAWLDRREVPLGEGVERYEVAITPSTGAPRTITCSGAACDYDPAAQAADGSDGAASLLIAVRQIGDFGASPPATLTLDS